MKNVLRVLKRDFLRILKAPASIVVVLALIVLLVLAATLALAQKIAPPSELTVPDFRGMTIEEAQNEAAKHELTITEAGSEFSDEYAEGSSVPVANAEFQRLQGR